LGQQRQPFDRRFDRLTTQLRTGLLSDGLRTYTYDHANRLTQVVSGTLTTGFTYNGAGDRVAKTVDGVETRYTLDPAAGLTQVLQETTDGQATSYLYGHDGSTALTTGLLAQYDSGTWAYHVNDGLGSVRGLADPMGQVVQGYSFSPFGVPLGESGGEPYGFTGEQWDASAGLVFLRARYYDPVTGRFITEDQVPGYVRIPKSLHAYVYAWNNPALLTDPSGWQVPPEDCQPGEICAGGTTGPYVVPSEPIPPAQPIEPPPTPPEPWPPIPVATPEPQPPYLPPTPDEIGQDEMLSALLQAQTCPPPTPGPAIIWGGHGDRPLHGFGQLRNFYVAASSWYRLYAEFGRGVGVCPRCAWQRAGGVYWSRMIGRIKVFENGTLLAVREEYDATGLYGDETLARAQVARELRVTTERGRRYGPFWLGSVFMGQKGSTTAERVWVDTSNGRPKEARMWLTMGAANSMPLTPFVGKYAMNLLP
jgi:RHS repeat-associated protein